VPEIKMSWYTTNRRSKYTVRDDDVEAPPPLIEEDVVSNNLMLRQHFTDIPMDQGSRTIDATFTEFDRAFRDVDKTLDKIEDVYDSDVSTNSGESRESYHFGGRQELSSDDDDNVNNGLNTTTASIHVDAVFITEPETHSLPESVEVQLVQLMQRVVQLEKKHKKEKHQSSVLQKQVGALNEELLKVQREAMEAEAMMGAQSTDALTMIKGVSSGNLTKERKQQEQQKLRDQTRKRLFAGLTADDGDDEDDVMFDLAMNPMDFCGASLKWATRCWRRNIPFRSDLIHIESRYGGSTVSFFVFFRWLFVNNLCIFVLQSCFFALHISQLLSRGHAPMNVGVEVANDQDLSTQWVPAASIQWLQLEGGIPSWASFSSYSAVISGLSDAVNIPLIYSSMLVLTQVILIGCTAKKWTDENKKSKMVEAFEGSSAKRWSKFLFTAFDHATHGRQNIEDAKSFITETLMVMHVEDNSQAVASGRTKLQWLVLYTRRFIVGIMYTALQLGGWFAILYLTVDGDVFKAYISLQMSIEQSDLLVDPAAVAVSIINVVNNIFVKQLVKQCKFDNNGTEIKALVALLFISRTFNIGIQLGAYAQLVAPMAFLRTKKNEAGALEVVEYFGISGITIRKTAKQFDGSSFSCRANQFGNQFFSLMVTEFAMGKILGIAVPGLKWIIAKLRGKKFVKSQFDISTKLVALLFFQQLSLISMPLLPISSVFGLIFLTLNFKWDVWILLLTQKKPKKPWSAKAAGAFYLKLYAVSLVLITISVHALMKLTTLPKMCVVQKLTIPTAVEDTIPTGISNIEHETQTFEATADCDVSGLYSNISNTSYTTSTYCTCSNACGPWIKSLNGYSPIIDFLASDIVPTTVYSILNSVQLWMAAVILLMVSRWNLMNSISVEQSVSSEKQASAKQATEILQKEIRNLRRKLTLQQQMNRDGR
jgi:hypothetical protein